MLRPQATRDLCLPHHHAPLLAGDYIVSYGNVTFSVPNVANTTISCPPVDAALVANTVRHLAAGTACRSRQVGRLLACAVAATTAGSCQKSARGTCARGAVTRRACWHTAPSSNLRPFVRAAIHAHPAPPPPLS